MSKREGGPPSSCFSSSPFRLQSIWLGWKNSVSAAGLSLRCWVGMRFTSAQLLMGENRVGLQDHSPAGSVHLRHTATCQGPWFKHGPVAHHLRSSTLPYFAATRSKNSAPLMRSPAGK